MGVVEHVSSRIRCAQAKGGPLRAIVECRVIK